MELPVSRLLLDKGDEFEFEVIAGESGLERSIRSPDLNRPGLALAGFFGIFSHDRVQIVGNTETSYLGGLDPEECARRLAQLFDFNIPCFIVTTRNDLPRGFLDAANHHKVPVLRTPIQTSRFYGMLANYLEREFAPKMTAHGVFVDVFGLGVLIMGTSGVGKSEIGLELIERGHRLIADDAVLLRKVGKDVIIGSALNTIQHHMELRGLGFVDVELLFGFGAIREQMRVSLVVELVKRSDTTDDLEDRFREKERAKNFLGVDLHQYLIPVEPGRNASIIIEVAALQHRILAHGRNPQKELNDMLIRQMTQRKSH